MDFKIQSVQPLQSPGLQSRSEMATGLLVRSIRVNGAYLLVDSCDVQPKQEIDTRWFVQGGPRASISDIGKKWVDGQIVCPLRVDRNGNLDPATQALLQNAELPTSTFRIDTNHVLSNILLTAESGGTDNNVLVSLDTLVVKNLTISVSPERDAQLIIDIMGSIDIRSAGDFVMPPDIPLGRALSWADCSASRFTSQMRAISNLEIKIENKIVDKVFLTAWDDARNDQISFFAVETCKWTGLYDEILRLGMAVEDYQHGGIKVGDNVVIDFGGIIATIIAPLYQIGEQKITPKILLRKNRFYAQTSPLQSNIQGRLFTYVER